MKAELQKSLKPNPAMAQHAKSFSWASFFFSSEVFYDVCALYLFCRTVDDIADKEEPSRARGRLNDLKEKLSQFHPEDKFTDQSLHNLHRLHFEKGLPLAQAVELIDGALSDLDRSRVADEAEFLHYCYQVAGTVGLMMCPLIGVRDPMAAEHAKSLGIAMQMTNICRDVKEDAEMGRVYLPETWLSEVGLSSEQVLNGQADSAKLSKVVCRALSLADQYYRHADRGMVFIPFRPRLSIVVASRIYRAIGLELQKRRFNPMLGRVFVSPYKKIIWSLKAVWAAVFAGAIKG